MSGSIRKESVFQFVNNLVVDLVTPVNISYLWNWGSLLGFFGRANNYWNLLSNVLLPP